MAQLDVGERMIVDVPHKYLSKPHDFYRVWLGVGKSRLPEEMRDRKFRGERATLTIYGEWPVGVQHVFVITRVC